MIARRKRVVDPAAGKADTSPAEHSAPDAARDPIVVVRDLTFSYGGPPALEGVNLEIARGDFASIIGPNGGGKTTLLKLILGLLSPGSGRIAVFGQAPAAARRRIGYLPQYAQLDALFPVTALDVVLIGRLSRAFPAGPFRREDRAAAERVLGDVGALDLRDRPFFSLSGGQRQRVLIARALVSGPELLLLDEPTASLDPRVQDDLYELLHRLNRDLTIVLVSHDVGTVSQHVRTVVCVNRQVEVHPSSAIHGELERLLFQGPTGARFVHHDAHADGSRHDPGHAHGH